MMRPPFLVAALVMLVALTSAVPACTHSEGLDTTKMPDAVRADYDLFARKCSKCHSLARPLTANITDNEQWNLYVQRMRRQPASGISPDDATGILRFLHYYAADLRRIQAEKNGAPATQNVPVLTPAVSPTPPAHVPTVDGGG